MFETNANVIDCVNLRRVYSSRSLFGRRRESVALSDLNLQIPKGPVFGLLGPNTEGKTILLTTHYMAEADMLCDTIAIINRGELAAIGTPDDIKRRFSRVGIVEVTVRRAREGFLSQVSEIPGVEGVATVEDGAFQKLTISVTTRADVKDTVTETIGAENIENLVSRDPTLEEAYINILK